MKHSWQMVSERVHRQIQTFIRRAPTNNPARPLVSVRLPARFWARTVPDGLY